MRRPSLRTSRPQVSATACARFSESVTRKTPLTRIFAAAPLDDELQSAVTIHFFHRFGQRQVIDIHLALLPGRELLHLRTVQHRWRVLRENNALTGSESFGCDRQSHELLPSISGGRAAESAARPEKMFPAP